MTGRRIIYKYPFDREQLDTGERLVFEAPAASRMISVQMQGDQLCFWVEIDLDEQRGVVREYVFWLFGTGWRITDCRVGSYVATVQDGSEVWHIYTEVITDG